MSIFRFLLLSLYFLGILLSLFLIYFLLRLAVSRALTFVTAMLLVLSYLFRC